MAAWRGPGKVVTIGACFFLPLCIVVLVLDEHRRHRRLAQRLIRELEDKESQRVAEHKGRINMEKELRSFMQSRLRPNGALFFAPIATLHSCFHHCVGTPRQGQFAPSTRAVLEFNRNSISPTSLEGLEEFSHVWVFWVFHLNTNDKSTRAHDDMRLDSRGHTFPGKVSPPFLKRRVGLFSARTPHRPNPIGVSLCRVEKVDPPSLTVHLSGVDVVDGTPVLDLKPYVPAYDSVFSTETTGTGTSTGGSNTGTDLGAMTSKEACPGGGRPGVRVAPWVAESVGCRRRGVEWTPKALMQLKEACRGREAEWGHPNRGRGGGGGGARAGGGKRGVASMRLYGGGDHEAARRAITESLSVDVRSLHKTKSQRVETLSSAGSSLYFDGVCVTFSACPSTAPPPLQQGNGVTSAAIASEEAKPASCAPAPAPAPLDPVRVTAVEPLIGGGEGKQSEGLTEVNRACAVLCG